jgi:hypothetical protein
MPKMLFSRDKKARGYATKHLKTDPGIRDVYYLPEGAPEREIRFVEINDRIAPRERDPLEPIDFGVDIGNARAHTLVVLDVTPAQWDKIKRNLLELPDGWTLDGAKHFAR